MMLVTVSPFVHFSNFIMILKYDEFLFYQQVKFDSGYSSLKVERHKAFDPTPQREKSTPQKGTKDKILRHSSLKHPPQSKPLPRTDASGKVLRHVSLRQPSKGADIIPRKADDRRKGYINNNNNTGFAIDQVSEMAI